MLLWRRVDEYPKGSLHLLAPSDRRTRPKELPRRLLASPLLLLLHALRHELDLSRGRVPRLGASGLSLSMRQRPRALELL